MKIFLTPILKKPTKTLKRIYPTVHFFMIRFNYHPDIWGWFNFK